MRGPYAAARDARPGGSGKLGAMSALDERPAAAPTAAVRRRPRAAAVLPERIFYGWYVAVACSVFMLVGVGVGYYGLAVFLSPLQAEHGWSNSAVSGATGLYFSVSGLTGAVVGRRIDREGPVRFMAVGTLLLGTMVSLIGYVEALWQLYAVYVVLAVGFGMGTAVAVNSVLTRWFVVHRAKAMSIAFTGISVGGVVLAPFGSWLIDVGGLELATPAMGLLVVAVALPVLAFVVVWDPAEMGLAPDDGAAPPTGAGALSAASQRRTWTARQAAATVPFWALLVAFVVVLVGQTGLMIHQVSFLTDRLGSRSTAAFALSVTAAGSIVARLAVGLFADRVDKRWLTVALFAVQATAVLALVRTDSVVLTYALTLVFGFTIGNVYMMQTLLIGEIFGLVPFGTVFGLVGLATQVASGVGPLFVGWLEDRSGGYALPFTITALATYAAAAALVFARPLPPAAEA